MAALWGSLNLKVGWVYSCASVYRRLTTMSLLVQRVVPKTNAHPSKLLLYYFVGSLSSVISLISVCHSARSSNVHICHSFLRFFLSMHPVFTIVKHSSGLQLLPVDRISFIFDPSIVPALSNYTYFDVPSSFANFTYNLARLPSDR